MKTWQEYCDPANWHEAANLFPEMLPDEIKELADDIKANGQKNPVILLDDKVLDGRNRLLACKLAGVSPKIESRNPEKLGSPTAWVVSQNLHRRHLNATQRALAAVEVEKLFAVEAKQRQTAAQNNKTGQEVRANLPEQAQEKGRARDKAARAFKVSPRYVQEAKKITKASPEVAAQAKAGKITMAEAKAATQPPKPARIESESSTPAQPSPTAQLREWFTVRYEAFLLSPSENNTYTLKMLNLTEKQVKAIGELLAGGER